MDEAKLQEIEARANAATPGPWRSGGFYGLGRVEDGDRAGWVLGGVFPMGRCAFCVRAPEPCSATVMHRGEYDTAPRAYHAHWIATESDDGWHSISSTMAALAITGNYDYEQGGVCSTPEDSAFITHARTDVPDLVAEVRRLTAALATVTAERGEFLRSRDLADEYIACLRAEHAAALATARREGAEAERERCVRIAKSYAGPFALAVSEVSQCALDIARDIDAPGGAT